MIKKFKFKNFLFEFIIVFALCTQLKAAIVSNSDGAAFVTKKEFENLKENFDTQLETYNDSIDNKVEGAISNYLKSLDIVERIQMPIINSTWEEISSINGTLDNTYKVPDLNLQFCVATMYASKGDGVIGVATPAQTTGGYVTSLSHFSSLKYMESWTTIKNCYRNLVTCTGPNPNNVGDIIWNGQAIRYREKYQINRSIMKWVHWSWGDRAGDETYSVTMNNFSTLKGVGYFTNWDSVKLTGWPIGYKWQYAARSDPASGSSASGTSNITFAANEVYDNFSSSVTLDADDDGNTKRYEHIISYKGDTEWRVSNPDWTNLINAPTSAESSITSTSVENLAAKTDRGIFCGGAMHVTPHQVVMETLPIAYTITDNAITPCIGLFNTKRKSNVMYQDNVKTQINLEKNTYVAKDKPKLHQGFQLLAVKEGDRITWEPEVSYTYVHNGATTYTKDTHQADLYFSMGPFTDDITTNASNKIKVKVNGGTIERDYATTETTSDDKRKCKIEFTAPRDGIVYVKWIPHNVSSTYLNSDWIVTLNLEKCNTYVYIRE